MMNFDDFLTIGNAQNYWKELAGTHGLPVEVIGQLHRESWDLILHPPNRKYIGLVLDAKIREYKERLKTQDLNDELH